MKRARLVVLASTGVVAMTLVACLHDFDAFGPAPDGGGGGSSDAASHDGAAGDATPPADALPGADGCTPTASCLSDGTTCAKACHDARATCEGQCNNKPPCLSGCASTEANCLTTCTNKCVTCTANAGCAAQAECANATK